jgi:uncharacterized protein (TIGR03503 family)
VIFRNLWPIITAILILFSSLSAYAQSISLLDNRFRVDPTIQQASFIIYRLENSQPVVIIRPDGAKYYAWKHPDNVAWYEEDGMDIISIENPMPGPWQAVGKVSQENKIKIISNLALSVDEFPARLYENERLKFSANLSQNDQPIVLRDFLDRVNLKVTFTPYIENEDSLGKDARPLPITLGEFRDDGNDLDEVPGDGIFTVSLPINVDPGKYRVRVTSGNGVFLRAIEQVVLVYPTPISPNFEQSRRADEPHKMTVMAELGAIEQGSINVHLSMEDPEGNTHTYNKSSEAEDLAVSLDIPFTGVFGRHSMTGRVYATDKATQRPLIIDIPFFPFGVINTVDVDETKERLRLADIERQKELSIQRAEQARKDARQRSIMIIVAGNILVIAIGIGIAFLVRKRRRAMEDEPELQLTAPPGSN